MINKGPRFRPKRGADLKNITKTTSRTHNLAQDTGYMQILTKAVYISVIIGSSQQNTFRQPFYKPLFWTRSESLKPDISTKNAPYDHHTFSVHSIRRERKEHFLQDGAFASIQIKNTVIVHHRATNSHKLNHSSIRILLF